MHRHQQEVLLDPTRFKVLVWHRRARKTTTALEKIVSEAYNPHIKNKVYWIVFPTYTEAKEAVWKDPSMLFRIIPKELIVRQNEPELTLYLTSGSIISLKGADKPDSLRGAGPFGVILDEFATMKEEAWGVIEPVIRENKGWAWFIGTPKGKNHLYRYYQRGVRGWSEWKSWLLKASESDVISREQLILARETAISEAFYEQEWECTFLEDEGEIFRGVRAAATAQPKKPIRGHYYVMGVDLAKVQDYTVIAVYDRADNAQVYQRRLKTIEWPFQKKIIKEISKHYNDALIVIDATGMGDPIADDLGREGLSVEPFKITTTTKKELIEKLAIWIEQKKIKLLPIKETFFEFDNFSYEISPTGKLRYGARQGFNDDIVIAHALAVWSLAPTYEKPKPKKKTEVQKAYEKAVARYQGRESYEIEEAEWSAI